MNQKAKVNNGVKQSSFSSSNKSASRRQKKPETSESQSLQKENFEGLMLIDLQNLDIDPIENKNGDRFIIDQTDQHNLSCSSQPSKKQEEIMFVESKVWFDVFYGRKNIMSLLQQRNEVCQMYNLNSKSRKQTTNLASRRTFTDLEIVQYTKELFEQSPSYYEYDQMCFAIIPQISSLSEKYFVFMSCDGKFVPQCKLCNLTAYLILSLEKIEKLKISNQNFGNSYKKSIVIKGKMICSNKKCKKQLLGQFIISQKDKNKELTNSSFFNKKNSQQLDQKKKESVLSKNSTQRERRKQPQLSQKQKILVKKAALKVKL